MSEEATLPVYNHQNGSSSSITFFTDDTIETIRYRIGEAVGQHPDRLRIYVKGQFPGDYYAKDSRKWEELFLRMSPEGNPIHQKSLRTYNSARDPQFEFEATEYDKTLWMSENSSSDASFYELRILGVPEERSFVYPLTNTEEAEHLPPPSQVSIDIKGLYKTLHPYDVVLFIVIPHSTLLPQVELLYYPRLRNTTPASTPSDVRSQIARQTELVRALSHVSAPKPDKTSVVQVRWKFPLVDTDFGNAIRNRFEQIFYGVTLSADIPTVTFFSSKQEQSRHKFFTENAQKTPILDIRTWNYWWSATRPSKNRPSLLFYRGTSRSSYDRITVNATEITLSSSRTDENKDSIAELQKSLKDFLLSIDGLNAFIHPADYDDDRWVLQDISAILHYSAELKEADFRRFDCMRSVFDILDSDKLTFKFLRSDQSDTGFTSNELQVLQLIKENEATTVEDVQFALPDATLEQCTYLLESLKQKISDNPELVERMYTDVPTFKFTAKQTAVTHVTDLSRIVKYISILRDTLIHPDNPELDDVCPKRVETIEPEIATVVAPAAHVADDAENDLLDELLGGLEDIAAVPETAAAVAAPEPKKARKVKAVDAVTTLHSYIVDELRKFDADTFDPEDPQILKSCERPRQPLILNQSEVDTFINDRAAYGPKNAGNTRTMQVTDPNGLVICPELWCVTDRIPLRTDQLVDGSCPVCGGKVRSTDKKTEKTQDIREFSVIQRDPEFVYPGYVKYKSKKNNKSIPCCFKTAQTVKVTNVNPDIKESSHLFYILGETKAISDQLRLAYIPAIVNSALDMSIDYKETVDAGNRIQSGKANFFRAGVGHAAESLPIVLSDPRITTGIPSPLNNKDVIVRCSFFRSWKGADVDGYDDKITQRIASIDKAFKEKSMLPLEELEYACMALDCMLYVLYVSADSMQTSCFMNMAAVRNTSRAVLVTVTGDSIDYITHVARTTTVPMFHGNLYSKLFPTSKDLVKKLEGLRIQACVRDVPTIDKAIEFVVKSTFKNRIPELQVILDPYMRAQAIFLPGELLLPFRPTSQIPTFLQHRVSSYSDIPQDTYPDKNTMITYLQHAKSIHSGYEYAHDSVNNRQEVVEIVTRSGLRIPVLTGGIVQDVPGEVVQTVVEQTEPKLVFGGPNADAVNLARSITYEAEIFDFLLFQLTKDLQTEDYADLRRVLSQQSPTIAAVKPLLVAWMDDTLQFVEADHPPAFYTKIRSACSTKDTCTGLCVWDGTSCRVQIKKVRQSLQRDKLEQRLLSTLVSNDKIRQVVFDNKVSPFFSSVLYLELPSEVILSDQDISLALK
jgi:hypothetical protein